MVNVYTEYFKELMDFLYGVILSSPKSVSTLDVKYSFSDYKVSFGQQTQLIETLAKADVIKIVHKIPLPPLIKFTHNTSGNEYSATGCLGYELVLNKDEFLQYRANSDLLSVNNDEHQYEFPHLSDDGRILFVEGNEITLSKHGEVTKSYAIAHLIFNNDDYQCTNEALVDMAGGVEDRKKPRSFVDNAVKYFNRKVNIPNFVRQSEGIILLNEKYTNFR